MFGALIQCALLVMVVSLKSETTTQIENKPIFLDDILDNPICTIFLKRALDASDFPFIRTNRHRRTFPINFQHNPFLANITSGIALDYSQNVEGPFCLTFLKKVNQAGKISEVFGREDVKETLNKVFDYYQEHPNKERMDEDSKREQTALNEQIRADMRDKILKHNPFLVKLTVDDGNSDRNPTPFIKIEQESDGVEEERESGSTKYWNSLNEDLQEAYLEDPNKYMVAVENYPRYFGGRSLNFENINKTSFKSIRKPFRLRTTTESASSELMAKEAINGTGNHIVKHVRTTPSSIRRGFSPSTVGTRKYLRRRSSTKRPIRKYMRITKKKHQLRVKFTPIDNKTISETVKIRNPEESKLKAPEHIDDVIKTKEAAEYGLPKPPTINITDVANVILIPKVDGVNSSTTNTGKSIPSNAPTKKQKKTRTNEARNHTKIDTTQESAPVNKDTPRNGKKLNPSAANVLESTNPVRNGTKSKHNKRTGMYFYTNGLDLTVVHYVLDNRTGYEITKEETIPLQNVPDIHHVEDQQPNASFTDENTPNHGKPNKKQ